MLIFLRHRFRLPTIVLCLVLAAVLGACMSQPIALTGTIIDAYTGKPVAAAKVKLGSTEVATDAAGKYQFASWGRKDTLEINAAGYAQTRVRLDEQPQLAKAAPPSVALDAKLRPNTLSGTVTDSYSNQPVVGATVQVSDTLRTTTGRDGRYTLAGVPESATLKVSAADHEPMEKALGRATTFDTTLRSNVLAGVVSDAETGRPLSGVQVKASGASATTGADGHYRLEGVPAGATVEIAAPGYAAVRQVIAQTTSFDAKLHSNVLSGVVTDQYSAAPIVGARVKAGNATATTGADGKYRLEGVSGNIPVVLSADGYAAVTQTLPKLQPLDVALRPNVLSGTLVDGSGAPIKNATIIATTDISSTDVAYTRFDNSPDGRWTLKDIPEQGYLQVLAPGYRKMTLPLKRGGVPATIKLERFEVKALYITAAVASSPKLVKEYFDLIDKSELNAIVIDLKSDLRDDLGLIYYQSQTPLAKELGTAKDYVDLRGILADAKKRGIYTIARVQLFSHDNVLADARPDWAIKDRATGKVAADYPGPGIRYAWLDPTNHNVWDYNTALAVEAAQMGFDEVNFDYIRFPDWNEDNLAGFKEKYQFSKPIDPVTNPDVMFDTITGFMEQAHRAVNGAGSFMSVSIFGRVVLGPSKPISQDIARMAPHTDYIAPMPYPSLWWPQYLGFANPTAHPYEVILGSLKSATPFFAGKRALLRPWLQGGTDPWQGARTVEYGPDQLRAEADAARDSGVSHGWMFYNSANDYPDAAFRSK